MGVHGYENGNTPSGLQAEFDYKGCGTKKSPLAVDLPIPLLGKEGLGEVVTFLSCTHYK